MTSLRTHTNFLPERRKTKTAKTWLTSGSLAILALGWVSGASAQQVGVNSAVKNEVSIQGEADADARAADVGGEVALRDVIRSGENAALQVLLLDETVFTVGAKAQLVVDKFIYDPDAGTGEMAASVARGAFRFMSGRTARRPDNVRIDTPVASMGVRGTIVEGAIGREAILAILAGSPLIAGVSLTENSTLIVLRGPGENQNGLNKDGVITVTNQAGTTTLNKPNTAVLVLGNGETIIGPFVLPDLATELLRDLLGTVPEGELQNTVPRIILPTGEELDVDLAVDPVVDLEDEQVLDRPTSDCVFDGIPTTDGGLILGGGQTSANDFGGISC